MKVVISIFILTLLSIVTLAVYDAQTQKEQQKITFDQLITPIETQHTKPIIINVAAEFIEKYESYNIYKRKVTGGVIYEYHLDAPKWNAVGYGFRVVFVPNGIK